MDQKEQAKFFAQRLADKDAEIARLRAELAEALRERDARPAISWEDASMFVDFDSERDAPHTWDDVQARVYDALHAHAARAGKDGE